MWKLKPPYYCWSSSLRLSYCWLSPETPANLGAEARPAAAQPPGVLSQKRQNFYRCYQKSTPDLDRITTPMVRWSPRTPLQAAALRNWINMDGWGRNPHPQLLLLYACAQAKKSQTDQYIGQKNPTGSHINGTLAFGSKCSAKSIIQIVGWGRKSPPAAAAPTQRGPNSSAGSIKEVGGWGQKSPLVAT